MEAPGQPLMLESAPDTAAPSAAAASSQLETPASSGIFSTSTVSALQGLGGNVSTQKASQTSGPLVGYGSDDESD